MAGIIGHIPSNEVSLTAATLKTVLQIVAAANHRVKVLGIELFFKGTSTTDTPVKVRVLRQTTAGTMTAATVVANDNSIDETLQTTGQHTATAEPTAGDVLKMWEVHPQSGLICYFPIGEEIIVKGGGRLGIECTAAQGQTAAANFIFEE